MHKDLRWLYDEIVSHESNRYLTEAGMMPVFDGSPQAKIVIIGQAPGIHAQNSQIARKCGSGVYFYLCASCDFNGIVICSECVAIQRLY